jgi:uncharacterized protein
MVGEMYVFGYSVLVPKNEPLGIRYLQSSAAHGYWLANDVIGVRYIQGRGVPADQCKALQYFQAAANANPIAGNELGNMYKDGLCISRDLSVARQWYQKAEQAGSKDAAQSLKNLQLEPDNASKTEINRAIESMNRSDWTNALPILTSLANRGVAAAQDQLGWSYLYGQGLKGNAQEAFYWFKKAADQGDSFAQALLGICYELGEGVPVDEQAAFSWYQRSANQKSGTGEFYLARAYEFGIGTRRDIKQARYYYYQASLQGNPRAEHYGDALANPNRQDARTEAEYQANRRKAEEEERQRLEYERTHPAAHCINPMAVMVGNVSQAQWSAQLWRQSGNCPLAPMP